MSSRQSAYHLIESSYAENEMDGPKDYRDDPRRAQYTDRKPQKRLCISVMCVCVAPENSKAETNKKKTFQNNQRSVRECERIVLFRHRSLETKRVIFSCR